jgi:beta-lactamase superfamily II metal-dependent hydrolase
MIAPAMRIEMLAAGFGDCLLLTFPVGTDEWRMLVDTGPDETYPALQQRLLDIPKGANGKRRIDLFVVTHIDHDHIGATGLMLADPLLDLDIGDIWFNSPPRLQTRGVAEGESLARLLGATDRPLPWNVAWSGAPVVTPAVGGGVELTGPGLPRLTLLSPTPERLEDLYKVWAKELARLRNKERDQPETAAMSTRSSETSLEALATKVSALDSAVANGSSIAMLVEHQGASVLLCADAFAPVLIPALEALCERRGITEPLKVDAIKLSHHGSRANVTQDLLKIVQADHYLFSTNGAYFRHPNTEAVARVILAGRSSTLWFNYDSPQTSRWRDPQYAERYGYVARYPPQADQGIALELVGRQLAEN